MAARNNGTTERHARRALPKGTRVQEFEILQLVGGGGFGIVYLAQDLSLGRRVALKEYMPPMASRALGSTEISVDYGADAGTFFAAGLRKFLNEARLLARFDHPALVKVYRFWEENRTAYMVMPFYEGPTLESAVARRTVPNDEGSLRQMLSALLDALAALHGVQCYHRDISPDNILLTANGPVLLDFGAARMAVGKGAQNFTVMLKEGYAPAEQYATEVGVTAQRQGPWTDIYALAGVIRYVITGNKPASAVARVSRRTDPQEPLTRIAAGRYSASFLQAIDAGMARYVEERPQSIAEFWKLLGGQPARPPTNPKVPALAVPATIPTIVPPQPATRVIATTGPGFRTRERITAPVVDTRGSYNRWLVPPAAVAVHLCIGMAYGFSVFWLPLSRAIGITAPKVCPQDAGLLDQLTTTTCDWKISLLTQTFTLFILFLGIAGALGGNWLERVGPRRAGLVSTLFWCGGLVLAALAIKQHQLWLLWLGAGVIGGIGLGLGYISPVSMLVKWFPDRRGMATGMAIMGFGGGALVGAPLADYLMHFFASPTDVGVWQTFLGLAAIYGLFMVSGLLGYRVPPPGWKPAGWEPPSRRRRLMSEDPVHSDVAMRTGQFWLLWSVLMLNVTAGISILAMASPMLQEVFGGRLIGIDASFDKLNQAQLGQVATVAAGFTGLLSLFNMAGRIFWASLSDALSRQGTYHVFFLLGLILYAAIPWTASVGSLSLFVGFFCLILSMYGGGFSTIPAYLADLFGTRMVGAIHGRLLTAWSTAGVVGTSLVTYIREYQIDHGVPRAQAYSVTMFVLAGLLGVGLICNLLVSDVAKRHHMTVAEIDELDREESRRAASGAPSKMSRATRRTPLWVVVLAWLPVVAPLAWATWTTLKSTGALFGED